MTGRRRATEKEQRKYGKVWMGRRSKPIIPSIPPPAPWSIEAIAAYDAAALARNLPPMMALNLHRIESGGVLRGVFDLYVTHWHLTLRNCRWFVKPRREWIGLPNRDWTDSRGNKHYEEIVVFDDVHLPRFQESALVALHHLLARAEAVDPNSASEHDQQPHHQPRMNGNGSAVHIDGHDDVPF